MIVDCISDLHGYYPELEGGDLLIVAGDLTAMDDYKGYCIFNEWMIKNSRIYSKCIVIAGNHDNGLLPGRFNVENLPHVIYLCDSGTVFEGMKIWGSPWTKTFLGMNPKCKAFTVDTENELIDKFEAIPINTDILITHSPPYGILDKTIRGENVGSKYLYNWLKYCGRPKIHVFGHIHEAYGREEVFDTYNYQMMQSVNASLVNERYEPVNKPIRIIL